MDRLSEKLRFTIKEASELGTGSVRQIRYKIKKGDYIKMEYAAIVRHYMNEAKSLVLVGAKPEPEVRDYYQLYYESINASAKAVKLGATMADVFEAGKKVFEEAGVKAEIHNLGHGMGLNGHEPPLVDPYDKTPIQPGLVFVIEPFAIYGAMSQGITTIVNSSGTAEMLPPFSEEIISI